MRAYRSAGLLSESRKVASVSHAPKPRKSGNEEDVLSRYFPRRRMRPSGLCPATSSNRSLCASMPCALLSASTHSHWPMRAARRGARSPERVASMGMSATLVVTLCVWENIQICERASPARSCARSPPTGAQAWKRTAWVAP